MMKVPFAPRISVDGAASVHMGHILSILREECQAVDYVRYLDYNRSEFYRYSSLFFQIQEKADFWQDFLEGEKSSLLERSMIEHYYGNDEEIQKRTPKLPIKYVEGLLKTLTLVIEDFIAPLIDISCDTVILCSSRSVFYEIIYAEVIKKKLPECNIIIIDNFTFESSVPYLDSFLTKKGYNNEEADCMLLGDPLFTVCSERFPVLFDYLVEGEGYDFIRTVFNSSYKEKYFFHTRCFGTLGEIHDTCNKDISKSQLHICRVIYSERINLDSLPLPDYSDMEKIYEFAEIEYSRGCNYKCVFCERTRTMRESVFTHSIEYMMRLLRKLNEYKFKKYTIIDCAINNNEQDSISLLTAMKENGIQITYQCNLRGKTPNVQLIRLLKETGCEVIGIGLETGDDRVLKSMNKIQNKEIFKKLATAVGDNGMKLMIFLIVGFPTETLESIDQTILFLKEIHDVCKISIVSCEQYYPGHVQYLRPQIFDKYQIQWISEYSKIEDIDASYFFTEIGIYGLAKYKKGMKRLQIRDGGWKYYASMEEYGIPINIPLN